MTDQVVHHSDITEYQAQCVAWEHSLSLLRSLRMDLDREALEFNVLECAVGSEHSAQDWAEHCIMRVRAGEPLPWERGATGVGAKS